MTRKFTPQEIEQLSAYLDGQLPIREKNLLELRLRDDPEMQSELEGLARTHLALRSLPRRRAPRSFALTPAMVASRQTLHLFPSFRLASALAAVLLVVAFASDLLLGTGGFTSALPIAVAPAEKQTVSTQQVEQAAPALAPEVITWGTPTPETNTGNVGFGKGGGAIESAPAVMSTQPAETSSVDQGMVSATQFASPTSAADLLGCTPQPQVTATPGRSISLGNTQQSETPTPTGEATLNNPSTLASLLPSPTVTETPTPTYTLTPTATETPTPAPTEPQAVSQVQDNPILGIQPSNNPEGMRVSAAAPTATSQPASAGRTLLRLSEVLLGAAAVITGLLAFFFYRKEKL